MNPLNALMPLIATLSSPAQAAPVAPKVVAPEQVVAPKVGPDPMQPFEQWMKFQPPVPLGVRTTPPNTSSSLSPASAELLIADILKVKQARPYNNRTLEQDDKFKAMLKQNGIPIPIPSDKNYIVHWTADEFRYFKDKSGKKIFLQDKAGDLIPKTAKELEDSMKGDGSSVNKIMTGMRGDNPNLFDSVPFNKNVILGHVMGATKKGQKPITRSEQTPSGNTIFQTNANNRNSYGIEVAFDPSMPGEFSENGKTRLRDHLIQTMIEQGIPPSQLFAHGEIQRDKSGGEQAGEMVNFIKDFRANLDLYVEQYQARKMAKFEADYQVKDSGKNFSSYVDRSQKQKMAELEKIYAVKSPTIEKVKSLGRKK